MAVQALRELIGRVLSSSKARARKAHKYDNDDAMARGPDSQGGSMSPNGAAKKSGDAPRPGKAIGGGGGGLVVNGKATTPPAPSEELDSKERMWRICEQVDAQVTDFLAREECETTKDLKGLQDRVRESLKIVEEALGRYRPEELSLSYNGGKDCLVLLILILASLHRFYARESVPARLSAIYIRPKHPFPEVDEFVETSSEEYCLELKTSPLPMKAALAQYLNEHPSASPLSPPQPSTISSPSPSPSSAENGTAKSAIKAIFVGTRRTDPHGSTLQNFHPTDGDWPRLMRVHPVIDWHYVDIWGFIRALGVEYCVLYDRGYTSLGGTDDTLPNPALAKAGIDGFRPAFELVSDLEERLGREK